MISYGVILGAVVPVFLIAGAGFVLRRVQWLSAEADQSMLRLTINLLLPCLILDSIVGNPSVSAWRNLTFAPLVGAGTFSLGIWVATIFAKVAGLQDPVERRTFAVTAGLYNYGFIPIPLSVLLFNQQTIGVLFLNNLGVEITLWTLGVIVMQGSLQGVGFTRILNPPLLAIACALLINFLQPLVEIPQVLRTTFHLLGQCAIPLSLILAGATIEDHLEEFHSRPEWKVVLVGAMVRLFLLPIAFLVLAKFIPAEEELKNVIVVQAAMPSAMFPIVMSKHYRGDPPTALRVVLSTSFLSLLTIPFWIRFGLNWVHH